MNAAQTKRAFLNHFWEAGELIYDTILEQRQAGGNETAGNKPRSTTRGKARTGTTRRGRRANTAGKDAPASAA